MEPETQTPRRFPLTTPPQDSKLPSRPSSPVSSSTGGRPTSTAVAVLSAMLPSRKPLRSTQPPKPPKILPVDKAWKRYGKEPPDAILALPIDTLRTLPAVILDELPADRLGNLPDDVLQRVSPTTLARASTGVLTRLPVQILATLPTSRLMKLDPAKLAQMDPRWLADFLREVPQTSQRLMSEREVVSRLLQLPPEEFIRLPHKALEMVPSEHFKRMPPHIWGQVSYERLISFPDNMRVAYPKGLPARLDPPEEPRGDIVHSINTPSIRTTSLTSASTAVWPPEGVPSLPQTSRSWLPTMAPIAPLAPFMPATPKPAPPLPPLPPAMPDIKAEMVQSLNGIRLDDLKIERDQLKFELRTEREKLNRQLGSLEAEKNHLESTKAQLEMEKRKTAEAIRHHLKDKNLGNIDRGQDEVQILLEFNKDLHRYVVDLEQKAGWWEEEHRKLHNQWISLDARRQELEAKLQEAKHAHAQTKQEIKDQKNVVRALDASKLDVARLQTSLARVEATWEARLEKQESDMVEFYTSQQAEVNEELRLLKLEKLKWERDMDALNAQRQSEQQALVNSYEDRIQTQQAEFSAQFQDVQQKLHDYYQAQVEESGTKQDEIHRQYTSELLERITSLESSLVDNSDDFRPATDDSLRNKYQNLKLTIDTITFNLGTITFPRGTRLDPGGFLERDGKGAEVHLLRSIFWEKLEQGFFSLPFGLGALGPGDGKNRLLDMFVAYRRISGLEPPGITDLPIFSLHVLFLTEWCSTSTFDRAGMYQGLSGG